MPETIRSFLAIDIPEELKKKIFALQKELATKAGFSTGVFTSGFAESFRSQWKITRKLEDRPERSEHTIRSLTGGGRSSVDGIKLVGPENIHITLKFLGNVPSGDVEKAKQLLKNVQLHSFKIQLKDIGVFPNENYVRVLWIDCKSRELQQLGEKINKLLAPLSNKGEFTPHLTIARIKQKCDLKDFLGKHTHDDFGTFSCKEFVLYKSELRKQGPIYTKVAVFSLK